jgi:hypothetical protein
MAVYPCDWQLHRYPGPQRSVYFSLTGATSVETHKLRLCQRHFEAEKVLIHEFMAIVDEDSAVSKTCERCQGDRSGAIYAKLYDEHTEAETWCVDVCDSCKAELGQALRIANGRPLGGR